MEKLIKMNGVGVFVVCFTVIVYAYITEQAFLSIASYTLFILLFIVSLNSKFKIKKVELISLMLSCGCVAVTIGMFVFFYSYSFYNAALLYLPAFLLVMLYFRLDYFASGLSTFKSYIVNLRFNQKLFFILTFTVFLVSAFLVNLSKQLILHTGILCVQLMVILAEE